MGFFGKIKQFLGIGTVKVTMEVDGNFKRSENVINGKILLSAKSDQEILEIKAELEEEWEIGKDENKKTETFNLGSWESKTPFSMKAGEEKVIPFTINYNLIKSKNDQMRDSAGKVGKALGGLGKLMDGEKSTFSLTATADVKGAAFDPNCVKIMKLID
ncbi:MAG: sporulation protein [Spirochaetes bacterium]|nr:sporulation protein [Spirochaetota bacterium]